MAKRRGIRKELAQIAPSGQTLERQLNNLLQKKQYSKAIRKLQQSLKRDPAQRLSITEADIWLKQGQEKLLPLASLYWSVWILSTKRRKP